MEFWRKRMPDPGNRVAFARYGVAALLVLGLLLAWGRDVQAQGAEDVKVILERMGRLERDIRTLNLSIARGAPAPASNTAAPPAAIPAGEGGHAMVRLSARLSELEGDLRVATGSMEQLTFQLDQMTNRLDKLVADVDYRLGVLEGRAPGATSGARARPQGAPKGPPRISAAPSPPSVQKIIPGRAEAQTGGFASPPGTLGTVSQSAVAAIKTPSAKKDANFKAAPQPAAKPVQAPAPVAANAPSVLPQGTPKSQYTYAFGLLRQANYDKAELALQEFVKLHPKDKLAGNARYWLGETFYVRAAYVQAAEVFLESYQAEPKGPKAPDSLLKLGMSLAGLDKKREACAAFDKLIKDFPDITSGIRNTVKREKQKNSCS